MKKLAVVLCVVIGLLGATVVGATEVRAERSAYQIYMDANEALNEAESYLMAMGMVMEMGMLGMTLTTEMESLIAMVMLEDNDFIMFMESVTSTMGEEVEMTMYWVDGIMYMDMDGLRIKMDMDLEDALAQANMDIVDFTEESINEESIEEVEEGILVSFVLSGESMMEEIMAQMGLLDGLMGDLEELEGLELAIGDILVTALIDNDDNLLEITMAFEMDMSMMGETISIVYAIHMEILEIGGVEIVLPDDLDEFEEVDFDALMQMGL